ncbi:mitochondrial Rho GTPase 1-like [Vicia villosa]|uniref:mitochondrial Rho GTPase 1-like n=1 Tax=Vicia villosa TaxID=3911 RepID=UPI00273B51EA|nr:mitochondrial Rho GTPase 1-like [Vicia villosa]
MEVEAQAQISVMSGDFNNIYRQIVIAAEHPHLSIPKTEDGKTRKQYHPFLDRSLMLFSVGIGAAVAFGMGVARKNAADKKTKGL